MRRDAVKATMEETQGEAALTKIVGRDMELPWIQYFPIHK